jgi:cellulose synthase/poly-beta-1,6-N-acetylglucosamine synthase-like glycosyltransferase
MSVVEWIVAACAGLIGFTWIGYPVCIAALATLRARRPAAAWPAPPAVSVVLATRESADAITGRVADVLAARYDGPLQVVVALDPRTVDQPATHVRFDDPRVTVVGGDAPGGKTATLNAGVRAATGELLVFTDTAQRFEPDAIALLVSALADERMGAVSGALHLPGDEGRPSLGERYWRYERWLRRNEARVHSTVGVTGAIYAMRRARWTPLPADLILDDVYVPMRLALEGGRVGFEERAVARDGRRTTAGQEHRRKVRTLTGNIQLCAWLPAVLVPGRNPIWLQFVCHKLLRLLTPWLLIALASGGAWLAAQRLGPALGVVARWAGVGLVLVLLVAPLRRRVLSAVGWFFSLQAAVVRATVNGIRGQWNVWGV